MPKQFQFRFDRLLVRRERELQLTLFDLEKRRKEARELRLELETAESLLTSAAARAREAELLLSRCELDSLKGFGDWSMRLEASRAERRRADQDRSSQSKQYQAVAMRHEKAISVVVAADVAAEMALRSKRRLEFLRDIERAQHIKAQELAEIDETAEIGAVMHYLAAVEIAEIEAITERSGNETSRSRR